MIGAPERCFTRVDSGLVLHLGMLLASLTNIILSWKGLPGTNALAYYEKSISLMFFLSKDATQGLKMAPVCVPKHFESEDEENDDGGVEGVDGRNDDSNDESRQCRNDGHDDEGDDGPEEDDLGPML